MASLPDAGIALDNRTVSFSGGPLCFGHGPAMNQSRRARFLRTALTYAAIVGISLVALDVVCIAFGFFPPRPVYGDPELGWRPAPATGRMALGRCMDVSTGQTIDYERNEDGVRTGLSRNLIQPDTTSIKIAVVGDSHTDLCAPNALMHSGVLESELRAQGIPAAVLSYGAGKYSPIQDYLAFTRVLRPYGPRVLIMNLYTGNDFYDILRVDDRPHFVAADTGYRLAPPVWYSRDDPAVRYRSRVLFAIRAVAENIGVRRLYLRVMELRRVAAQQGAGLTAVAAYMQDLYNAREPMVGYPDAFTSQMLNQQLFFHHFPASQAESIRRTRALMALIRAENPGLILVMSPLPSYQLAGEQPVDSVFLRTLQRIPIGYQDGVSQEQQLYDQLRVLAAEQGWLFVDNLAALKAYRGSERLYNTFDYHLLPPASALIGRAQAAVLRDTLRHLAPGPGAALAQ